MKALRLIVFGMALAAFILFAIPNWVTVPVNLGASMMDIKLPVLLLLAFLIGWLPTLLLHYASKATWRRRLAKVDRRIDATFGEPAAVVLPGASIPPAMPAQAQPTVVPPAGA